SRVCARAPSPRLWATGLRGCSATPLLGYSATRLLGYSMLVRDRGRCGSPFGKHRGPHRGSHHAFDTHRNAEVRGTRRVAAARCGLGLSVAHLVRLHRLEGLEEIGNRFSRLLLPRAVERVEQLAVVDQALEIRARQLVGRFGETSDVDGTDALRQTGAQIT